MNKDTLNKLPADEQPIASKLNSIVDDMQLSRAFQTELETQLMKAAKNKNKPDRRWQRKIIPVLGWTIVAAGAVLLLNWTIRSLTPNSPSAAGAASTPVASFETDLRQGNICTDPLTLGHGFDVFLTNPDKSGFISVDEAKTIGELRSFAWSPDGEQLAILGNTTGRGEIHLVDPDGNPIGSIPSNSELGYLREFAWSLDGEQLATWSSQDNRTLYLLNVDGSGPTEKGSNVYIQGVPQFWPDRSSILFSGSDATSAGLFEMMLLDSETSLLNPSVEGVSSYAFSPDGSHLAYMEYDREMGEARLISLDLTASQIEVLGTLPIPKGPGSSVPATANLSWSGDGIVLTFDFGRGLGDSAVYLAYSNGNGMVKVAESAYAPAISADGKCLAYISDKQVFLLDMTSPPTALITTTPILVGDLPTGRAIADYRLDKLQWRP